MKSLVMKIVPLALFVLLGTEALWAGTTYTNYPNGLVESMSLREPDDSGNVYYHYMNANTNKQGYRKVDKIIRAKADADGAIAYTLTYYSGKNLVECKYGYKEANCKTVAAKYEYVYDSAGREIRSLVTRYEGKKAVALAYNLTQYNSHGLPQRILSNTHNLLDRSRVLVNTTYVHYKGAQKLLKEKTYGYLNASAKSLYYTGAAYFAYDAYGNLTSKIIAYANVDPSKNYQKEYTYDASGRETSYVLIKDNSKNADPDLKKNSEVPPPTFAGQPLLELADSRQKAEVADSQQHPGPDFADVLNSVVDKQSIASEHNSSASNTMPQMATDPAMKNQLVGYQS